jgi:hypothetical protein
MKNIITLIFLSLLVGCVDAKLAKTDENIFSMRINTLIIKCLIEYKNNADLHSKEIIRLFKDGLTNEHVSLYIDAKTLTCLQKELYKKTE